MSDTASIELWHKRARPEPTFEDFNVQLGCHFEEIAEMVVALAAEDRVTQNKLSELGYQIMGLAEGFKSGKLKAYANQREEFLDSIADQIVTGVGVAYCNGMKITQAMDEVNKSNWSKFDHLGQPYFDDNGKIKKGPNYTPPQLESMT